jgi:hypothetical protein
MEIRVTNYGVGVKYDCGHVATFPAGQPVPLCRRCGEPGDHSRAVT